MSSLHTDAKNPLSKPSEDTRPQDKTFTSSPPLFFWAATGCTWLAKITLNWVPSHVGLSGNEAADELQISRCPSQPHHGSVLPSLSQLYSKIKSALGTPLSRPQHEATVRLSSPSCLRLRCCNSLPTTFPKDPSIPPHVRGRLTPSPLGFFPAFEEIRQGDVDIHLDHCQVTSPFLHSNTTSEVQGKRPHLRERLPPHPQPGHPGAAADAAAVIACPSGHSHLHVREYHPPKVAPTHCLFLW
ncbi:hypothetical protein GWK47_044702 [Chionoecetes opilio]|uniref:RNase H type-1 domain-containing protein n=1 Tax=Chionoecetes opilio TaxID=41210 RepID=A0A8J4YFK2_CHIOP|nr:hypothetical protein GWK47_044702 [Chionoecetes opilio]